MGFWNNKRPKPESKGSRIQRSYSRTVEKPGGKYVYEKVADWQHQRSKLKRIGYDIAYVREESEEARNLLYRVTFPDGHSELMSQNEIMLLENEGDIE